MKKPYKFPGLKKEMQRLRKCAETAVPELSKQATYIIENGIREEYEIEKALDSLLNMMLLGYCEEDFMKLNKYYSSISPESSAFYDGLLKETFFECD